MRYKEFKEDLFEVKMSPGNLKKMAAEIDALVGIEFEMYVPRSDFDEDGEEFNSEPNWDAKLLWRRRYG